KADSARNRRRKGMEDQGRGRWYGAGVVGVHQVVALVVEDGGRAQAALLEETRGGEDEGGLAGAQKTADYREDGLHSASSLPSAMVALGVDFFPLTVAVRTASVPWSTRSVAPPAVTRKVPHPVAVLQKQRKPGAAWMATDCSPP